MDRPLGLEEQEEMDAYVEWEKSKETHRKRKPVELEYEEPPTLPSPAFLAPLQLQKKLKLPKVYDWSYLQRPPLEESVESFCSKDLSVMVNNIDYEIADGVKERDGVGQGQSVPILRIYATTEKVSPKQPPRTVLIKVHGFQPYFYCSVPDGMDTTSKQDLEDFFDHLEHTLQYHWAKSKFGMRAKEKGRALISVTPVEMIHGLGLQHKKRVLLKITTTVPTLVATARRFLEDGMYYWRNNGNCSQQALLCYEANVPFVVRFMVDANITGASWLQLPAKKFAMYGSQDVANASLCQIEVDIYWKDIISQPVSDEKWMKFAPFRILSFDLECAKLSEGEGFPSAANGDPVITIGCYLYDCDAPLEKAMPIIFSYKDCTHVEGVKYAEFDSEAEMLKSFASFIRASQPDWITGYNINTFDWPYLVARAEKLGIEKQFTDITRLRKARLYSKDTVYSSKAHGTKEGKETVIAGILMVDMLEFFQKGYKFRSYTLNAMSAQWLGQQKDDVHHSEITPLWKGTTEQRGRLAKYCLRDAWLPLKLMDKFMLAITFVETSRVKGTPMSFILTRGQQVNTYALLLQEAKAAGVALPNMPKVTMNIEKGGKAYKGATVLEPKRGLYLEPITTLDYASLYPSCMIAHNLCYTTHITQKVVSDNNYKLDEDYEISPDGDMFVKRKICEGLLPRLLEKLLKSRAATKLAMKKEVDPFKKAVLDKRQNELKLLANSVYGFTGATAGGTMPFIPVSRSTTSHGRRYIELAAEVAKSLSDQAPSGVIDVLYGDTDSIMVSGKFKDFNEAHMWSLKAVKAINEKTPPAVKIVWEKVYMNWLLINKKRYAGVKHLTAEKAEGLDTKGLETCRRDNCLFAVNIMSNALNTILLAGDVKKSISDAKAEIQKLERGEVDMYQLRISKGLQKRMLTAADQEDLDKRMEEAEAEDAHQEVSDYKSKRFYASKQPHAVLHRKMEKRDPTTAPHIGDRVWYVIIAGDKKTSTSDRAEDPLFAQEHDLPIDVNYYKEKQLQKPLHRIYKAIDKGIVGRILNESVVPGERKQIIKPVSKDIPGTISSFFACRPRCVSCSAVISNAKNGKARLCQDCELDQPRKAENYMKCIQELNHCEEEYRKLWTQCQNCQKSHFNEVICGNNDCPIFYRRVNARKFASRAVERVRAFSDLSF